MGRFDVAIEGADRLLALVAAMMNIRSRLTGIATGDQAIFVRRAASTRWAAFRDRADGGRRAMQTPAAALAAVRLRERVTTSARRWRRHGTLRTIFLMWGLRLAYALGADPRRLARRYDVERTSS